MRIELIYVKNITKGLILLLSQHDKRQHIACSFLLYILALNLMPAGIALLIVFLIGVMKETWDKYYGTGFCYFDLIGNCIGIGVAIPFGLVIKEFNLI